MDVFTIAMILCSAMMFYLTYLINRLLHRLHVCYDSDWKQKKKDYADASTNTSTNISTEMRKFANIIRGNGTISTLYFRPTGELVEVQHQIKKND